MIRKTTVHQRYEKHIVAFVDVICASPGVKPLQGKRAQT